MFAIRLERHEDINQIKEVNDLAFKQENEARLIEAIRTGQTFIPELSLVAESEHGKIIGHILFSKIKIDTGKESVQTLALAPMAVIPIYQGKGIGTALVTEGLKKCREMGFTSIVVLGHPTFYPRFGFVPAHQKGIQPPFDVADEVFMVLDLVDGALSDVQGTVRYPDAFMNV